MIHFVRDPPEGWAEEAGLVDDDLLRRWLSARFERFQYFICGPPPMMDATENALVASALRPGASTPRASPLSL